MAAQAGDRAAVRAERVAPPPAPSRAGAGLLERRDVRQDPDLASGDVPQQQPADAVPQRIAGREHDHRRGRAAPASSASVSASGERQASRGRPSSGSSARCRLPPTRISAAARASRARLPSPAEPVGADADHGQPGLGQCGIHEQRVDRRRRQGAAAAAPAQGDVGQAEVGRDQRLLALGRADEARPGTPGSRPGRSGQSRSRSSRWNRAVGALPIATTAPSRWGRHSSTAAAERVVPRPAAEPGVRSSSSVCRTSLPRRQTRRHDAGRDHARVDQDRRAGGQRRPPGGDRIAAPGEVVRDVGHAAGVDQAQDEAVQAGGETPQRHLGADQRERRA